MEYASNSKGNLGVALGAIGTGLGVLNAHPYGMNFMGGYGNYAPYNNVAPQEYVTKETFDLSLQLMETKTQNAILTSELNTEKKMVEVFNAANDKINRVVSEQAAINAQQACTNTATTSMLSVLQNNMNQLMGLTKLVIPNPSVCPGWGEVTITPAAPTVANA